MLLQGETNTQSISNIRDGESNAQQKPNLLLGPASLATVIVTFVTVAVIRSLLGEVPLPPGVTRDETLLLKFADYGHTALIAMLTIFLGWLVRRYHRPFFVLLFHGYFFWGIEYGLKCIHIFRGSVVNGIESYFFFCAGAVLVAPESWWSFPAYDSTGPVFLRPIVWVGKYLWNNPLIILPLTVALAPAAVEKPFPWVYESLDALYFMTAVMLLGFGLYRRLLAVSPKSALVALVVHSLYLWPQVGNWWWKLHGAQELHNGALLEAIHIPALVLKPALVLFATVVAFREIDEQRRSADEQSKAAAEKLRVNEIVQEMKAEARSQQQLRTTESFARKNIHAVRTLLQLTNLHIDTIERQLASAQPPNPKDLRAVIDSHYDLIVLVKPENQQEREAILDDCPIARCIERALDLIRRYAQKLNIAVYVDDNGLADVNVHCDPDLLNMAVVNLLVNAVEAIEKDGDVRLEIGSRAHWVCITIRDSGPGVTKQQQDNLFHLGYTTKPGGTGVGLAESRKAVESMHGILRFVKNAPGAVFEIAVRQVSGADEVEEYR